MVCRGYTTLILRIASSVAGSQMKRYGDIYPLTFTFILLHCIVGDILTHIGPIFNCQQPDDMYCDMHDICLIAVITL